MNDCLCIFLPRWIVLTFFVFTSHLGIGQIIEKSPTLKVLLGSDLKEFTLNHTLVLNNVDDLSGNTEYDVLEQLYAISPHKSYFGHISRLWHQNKNFPSNLDTLFYDGIFWSLIVIDNPSVHPQTMHLKNELPLASLRMHQVSNLDQQINLNLDHWKNNIESATKNQILVEIPPGKNTFLIGFENANMLTIFAPKLLTKTRFEVDEFYTNLALMFLYGGLASLWIYNFALVTIARLSQYAYFLAGGLGVIGVSMSLIGLPAEISSYLGFQNHSLWAFWVTLVLFGVSRFTLQFFDTVEESKFFYSTNKNIINLYPFFGSLFYVWENLGIFIPVLIIVATTIGTTYIIRFGLPRSHVDSVVYVANALPLGLCGIYLSCQYLGFAEYNKFSFLLFMLISALFLLLISLNAGSFIISEKIAGEKLAQTLELGHKVQKLLFPSKKSGKVGAYHFAFDLRTEIGMMSGDWIYYWQTSDQTLHVIMGDVAGKGPQAALVVSAIFMVLERQKQMDAPLTPCFQLISHTLYQMFSSNAATTATGFSLKANGQMTVINSGGMGLLHTHKGSTRHLLWDGPILGISPQIEVSGINFQVNLGDLLVMATNGVASRCHYLKSFVNEAFKYTKDLSAEKICSELMEWSSHRHQDDRALFVIHSPEAELRATSGI